MARLFLFFTSVLVSAAEEAWRYHPLVVFEMFLGNPVKDLGAMGRHQMSTDLIDLLRRPSGNGHLVGPTKAINLTNEFGPGQDRSRGHLNN